MDSSIVLKMSEEFLLFIIVTITIIKVYYTSRIRATTKREELHHFFVVCLELKREKQSRINRSGKRMIDPRPLDLTPYQILAKAQSIIILSTYSLTTSTSSTL